MKKLTLLFAIFALTFSCTKTDDSGEVAFVPDPTIIAEYHRVNSNDVVHTKYSFDEIGRFTKLHKLSQDFTMNFEYDSESKIINIVKKDLNNTVIESYPIEYGVHGLITSLGNTSFTFHETDSTSPGWWGTGDYLLDETDIGEFTYIDELDPNISETERGQARLFLDDNLRITSYNSLTEIIRTNTLTGEELFYTSWWDWEPFSIGFDEWNNVPGFCEGGSWYLCTNYSYDSNENSLYSTISNIQQVFWAAKKYVTEINEHDFVIILSANNFGEQDPFGDPDFARKYVYAYEYNDSNLPVTSSYDSYINDSFTGFVLESTSSYGKYYYQTDQIPE